MLFLVTGWRCKQFRGTGWRRKQSKKQSKQWSKGRYLHYQNKFSTKIIQRPVCPKDHPRRNTYNWLAGHGGFSVNQRNFGRALEGAPEGDCHGRGTQWRAHFPDSEGCKLDRKGWLCATENQHHCNYRQVDSPNPNFQQYLWLPNADWDTRYFQSNRARGSSMDQRSSKTKNFH